MIKISVFLFISVNNLASIFTSIRTLWYSEHPSVKYNLEAIYPSVLLNFWLILLVKKEDNKIVNNSKRKFLDFSHKIPKIYIKQQKAEKHTGW